MRWMWMSSPSPKHRNPSENTCANQGKPVRLVHWPSANLQKSTGIEESIKSCSTPLPFLVSVVFFNYFQQKMVQVKSLKCPIFRWWKPMFEDISSRSKVSQSLGKKAWHVAKVSLQNRAAVNHLKQVTPIVQWVRWLVYHLVMTNIAMA